MQPLPIALYVAYKHSISDRSRLYFGILCTQRFEGAYDGTRKHPPNRRKETSQHDTWARGARKTASANDARSTNTDAIAKSSRTRRASKKVKEREMKIESIVVGSGMEECL